MKINDDPKLKLKCSLNRIKRIGENWNTMFARLGAKIEINETLIKHF